MNSSVRSKARFLPPKPKCNGLPLWKNWGAKADELKVLLFDADFGKLPGIGAVHPSEVHPPKSG